MIQLSQEIEALAKRLAAAQSLSIEEAIRLALEEKARAAGVAPEPLRPRRRMSVESMLAVGSEIAAMPVLDPRSPREIMDDLNAV
jgi:antitoxin VapB